LLGYSTPASHSSASAFARMPHSRRRYVHYRSGHMVRSGGQHFRSHAASVTSGGTCTGRATHSRWSSAASTAFDATSHALGHADLNRTLGIYGHFDGSDLEGAMETYADWIVAQEPSQ
jgi:hypothetical protein